MIKNEIYDYMFKRVLLDLDELMNLAMSLPKDCQRFENLRVAREHLLNARPGEAFKQSAPAKDKSCHCARPFPNKHNCGKPACQFETHCDLAPERSGGAKKVTSICVKCWRPASPDSTLCPFCEKAEEILDEAYNQTGEEKKVTSNLVNDYADACLIADLGGAPDITYPGEEAGEKMNWETGEVGEDGKVATWATGQDGSQKKLDFRGEWLTVDGTPAKVVGPQRKDNMWEGTLTIPGILLSATWDENGRHISDSRYDLKDRLREGKFHPNNG